MDLFSRSVAAAAIVDGQHFSIPGCGTLEGHYIPARIDHVRKIVEPPQLEVLWTSAVRENTPTLAQLLESTGATSREARNTEDAWMQALAEGKAIHIGDLGYLEMDSQSQLVGFFADEEALRRVYWGGGAVAFEPLEKRAQVVSPTVVLPPVTEEVLDLAKPGSPFEQSRPLAANPIGVTAPQTPIFEEEQEAEVPARTGRNWMYIIASAAVVLAAWIAIARPFGKTGDDLDSIQKIQVSQDRLNKSPRDIEESATLEEQIADYSEDEGFAEAQSSEPLTYTSTDDEAFPESSPSVPSVNKGASGSGTGTTPQISSSPASSPAVAGTPKKALAKPGFDPADLAGDDPDGGMSENREVEVVIILGSFGQAENAGRLTEKLAAAGLIPFVDQPNQMTRVGVTFTARNAEEIESMLRRMRSEFNPNAWVLE